MLGSPFGSGDIYFLAPLIVKASSYMRKVRKPKKGEGKCFCGATCFFYVETPSSGFWQDSYILAILTIHHSTSGIFLFTHGVRINPSTMTLNSWLWQVPFRLLFREADVDGLEWTVKEISLSGKVSKGFSSSDCQRAFSLGSFLSMTLYTWISKRRGQRFNPFFGALMCTFWIQSFTFD